MEKEFNGTHSVSIYSVQASIPMEPAAIWNSEFVQAEELFLQPSTTDNCLRDNRYVTHSSVIIHGKLSSTVDSALSLKLEMYGPGFVESPILL